MLRWVLLIAAAAALLLPDAAQAQNAPPYWASIAASEARMRTGPGRQFPAIWLYRRAGLPVRVIETYPNWRKVEDPDGAKGWIQANLLSDDRTGLIRGGEIRTFHETPSPAARVLWRAEPGVVGRISECRKGWCRIDVRGRIGYVDAAHLWGVDPAEARR